MNGILGRIVQRRLQSERRRDSLTRAEELLARLEAARGELDRLARRRGRLAGAGARARSASCRSSRRTSRRSSSARSARRRPMPQSPDELRALVEEYLERLELWPELHGQAESVRYSLDGRRQAGPAR